MKRTLFLFLCLSFSAMCTYSAPIRYRVYECNDKVEYKTASTTVPTQWNSVLKGVILSPVDSIRVHKGGLIRVEHIHLNTIYALSEDGPTTVFNAVNKAKNDNARHIKEGINKELASGKTKPMELIPMNVVGVGTKGIQVLDTLSTTDSKDNLSTSEDTNGMLENPLALAEINTDAFQDFDSLNMLVDQLVWIGSQACANKKSPHVKGLTFRQKKQANGEWDFEFVNNTDKNYHINVLHINKRTNALSLCYVITPEIKKNACPMTPKGYCTYALNINFPNSKDDVYVLIALDKPYDSFALDNELNLRSITEAKQINTDIKYQWK